MPLFYQQNINASTQWAVWRIEENEEDFAITYDSASKIMHPARRLQHIVGRSLLSLLIGEEDLSAIRIAGNGKPYFNESNTQFSISHCTNWAAVITSDQKVGIDIEIISERVARVQHKFVHTKEEALLANIENESERLRQLSFIWAAKEAMYKWFEKTGVDFKSQLSVNTLAMDPKGITKGFIEEVSGTMSVYLHYAFFENVVCVTCMGA